MTAEVRPAAVQPIAPAARSGFENLLDGFVPSFEFQPVNPLPEAEFADRLRRIRREATVAGHDALLVHADIIGWYHASNSYLRYMCDWAREGVLVVPTDDDKPLTLFSLFSSSVKLPPAGEPVLVEDIWQVGTWGRETYNRPGRTADKVAEAVAQHLVRHGFAKAEIGLLGDATSQPVWNGLATRLPGCRFAHAEAIVDRMQRVRSPGEQRLVRAAAQLASIGRQVAPFVMLTVLAALQSVPGDVREAARVDGADPLNVFRTATLPHIAPALQLVSLLVAVWSIRRFDIIYLLTGGGPVGSTATLVLRIRQAAFEEYDLGGASAYGAVGLVLALMVAAAHRVVETRRAGLAAR